MRASDFKQKDATSYDKVVDLFDHHTEKYSVYAVQAMLSELAGEPQTVLDVGCGSGIATLAAAEALGKDCTVTGTDLSAAMLELAKQKAARKNLPSPPQYIEGDAESLPFEDATFDAAISLYAFRHFPDPLAAAKQIFRVLKPGGQIIIAVGSSPSLFSSGGLRTAFVKPVRILRERLGLDLTACDQIDRLVDTHLPLNKGDEEAAWTHGHHGFSGSLSDIIRRAGFDLKSSKWIGKQYEISSIEDYWTLQTTFSSKARKRLNEGSKADRAQVKQIFSKQCEATLKRRGRLLYRVGAAIITARRPV